MRDQQEWKILLVDDDEDEYLLTRSIISKFKHCMASLDWVNDFSEGVKALEENHYDAALIDYDLGPQTGIELIKKLSSRNFSAPLILYTGRGSYETDIEAMQAGATLYINKGEATPLLLERLIRYAIQLKKTETALRQARDEAERRAGEAEDGRRVLNSILSCIPEGIAISENAGGEISMISEYGKAQLHQLSGNGQENPSAIRLESWPVYYPGGDIRVPIQDLPIVRAAALGEEVKNEKLVLKGADGAQISILCNAGPIIDGSGKVTGGVITWQDITEQIRSRKELETNHALFAAVLKQMPSGVAIAEANTGKLLLSNDQAQNIWQVSPPPAADISANLDFQGYHPDGSPYAPDEWPLVRTLQQDEVVNNEQITYKRADNSIGVISVSSCPVFDSQGTQIAGVAVFLDISEQKWAELALRESEARITNFLENLQDGFFALDRDWNFTYINKIAAGIINRLPQELLGKNIWELWPQLLGTELEQRYRQVMETKIPLRFKYPGLASEIWFEIAVNPTMDGISIYWVDITQRKQMEDHLAYLALVLDNVHDAVLATDENQVITAWNQAAEQLYGWSEQEAIGKTGSQLLRSEFSDEQRTEVKRRLAEVHRCSLEMVQYTKDGRRLVIEGNVIAIRDASGKVTGYVSSNRDITGHKQASEAMQYYSRELEQSNKELEEFAATASHDLQEPLRKIEAFSALLETEILPEGEKGRLYIGRLKEAAARMRKMLDGLLALSQVRASGHAFQPVDLNEVAREVLDNLEFRLKQTGGQVEVSRLPAVEGDPIQMIQLLQNLVGNALKFHKPGVPPLIKVEGCQLDFEHVEIRVIDNGTGFDPQYREQVFQPFYRLHPLGEYDGTGMGLSICRKIVERHGGEISVTTSPTQGSTFTVTLPITPVHTR